MRNDRDRHRDGREDARRARAELEEEEEGGEEDEDDDEEDLALNGGESTVTTMPQYCAVHRPTT